jgi:LPS-assembly protein
VLQYNKYIIGLISFAPVLALASPFNDWLHVSQREYLCQGYYAPDLRDYEQDLTLKADQIQFTLNKDVYLKGDVALFWKQHEIYAHDIELIQDEEHLWQYLKTDHEFLYQTPLWAFNGQNALFQRQPEYIRLNHAQYRYYPHHAHGKAEILEATKETLLLIDATYSTCNPQNPTWRLNAKSIKLKPKAGRASARNINMTLKGVPIFYWPYVNYPIDNKRHSGFLFPNYGSTNKSGMTLTVPYYWNMAPNKDAVLSAKWMSERGLELRTKFRYLYPNHNGELSYHILVDDDKFDEFQQQNRNSPPPGITPQDPRIQTLDQSTTRQGIKWQHNGYWGDYWQGEIKFEWVSDDNYFVDLGQDLHASSQSQLPQRAKIKYQSPHWYHELGIEEYQVLQPLSSTINEEIYKRQPHWDFAGFYPDFWNNFSFDIEGQAVNFTHGADPLTKETVTTGNRSYLQPKLSYYASCNNNYIKPSASIHWRYYDLQRGDSEKELPTTKNIFIPEYSIDAGLYFERPFSFKGHNLTQTLEPRAFYVYIPQKDQSMLPTFDSGIINYLIDSLYTPNRFLGNDRIGDTHHATVGLQSRIYGAEPYFNYIKIELAEIFYFKGRTEQLCEKNLGQFTCFPSVEQLDANHSDLLFSVDWHSSKANAGFWTQWDVGDGRIEQSSVYADYTPNSRTRFNAYYTWARQDFNPQPDLATYKSNLQQIDLSGYFSFHPRWQALFRTLIDLKYNQFADAVFGLEYNSCCMAMQLVGNRYRLPNNLSQPVEYANGIFLQVAFKGLSTIGLNQADTKLKKKIPGYSPFGDRIKGNVLTSKTS